MISSLLKQTLRRIPVLLLLLFGIFTVLQAQTFKIQTSDEPLKKVLETIEQQSQNQYVFFYDNKLIEGKTVTLNYSGKQINEVLREILTPLKLGYFIVNNKNIILTTEQHQTRERALSININVQTRIEGVVRNQNGQTLPGVTVKIKESSMLTVTDQNGRYALEVPIGNTLVFSSIGYTPREILINKEGEKDVSVSLFPFVENLKEVNVTAMNTGYQKISKERATGSYDVIGPDVLSRRPASNISTALEGMVAGMQGRAGANNTSFLVRGAGTMYGDTQPLVVVDGFPVDNLNFGTINPNDVESVTLLKDAAASSIWGVRAANGVLVVTTKQGKAGKMTIEGKAFTRIGQKINLDQQLANASSQDQIRYERLAWANKYYYTAPYSGGGLSQIRFPMTMAQEYLYKGQKGLISQEQMNLGLDSLASINNRQQISDLLLQSPITNQYNATFTAGNERSQNYASLMYEKSRGDFVKNGFDKVMLNLNNQFQLTKFLRFNIGALMQYGLGKGGGSSIGEIQGLSPYETLLNPDGSYAVNLKEYNRMEMDRIPVNRFPYPDWSYNLLREVRGRSSNSESIDARLQTGLQAKIWKGLTADVKFQYELSRNQSESSYSEDTYYVRNMVNSLVNYDPTTQTISQRYLPMGGILQSSNSKRSSYVLRGQLNYDRTFAEKHVISTLAGMEISRYLNTNTDNPWRYGYNPLNLQSTVPPYGYGGTLSPIQDFAKYSVGTIQGATGSLGWGQDRYVSFFGNAAYTYDKKYTLSASIRSDGSNYVTSDPRLRWSPMWSVGGMWNLKQELFLAPVDWVQILNVRLTYGKTGYAEKSTSTETTINQSSGLDPLTNQPFATITPGNPLLRWERTSSTNLGIDFVLFKNRLQGKVDLYNRMGRDITGLVALPSVYGVTQQRFNNAQILNRGIELTLGTNVTVSKDISYSANITYAYNYNQIKDLYLPNQTVNTLLGLDFGLPASPFVQGRPVGALYSYTYRGMVEGTPQVEGPGGQLYPFGNSALYSMLGLSFLNFEGTTIPPHTFGWMNTLNVHRFYLTGLITGKFGGIYRNPTFNYDSALVGQNKTGVNRWVADVFAGDERIPGFSLPNNVNLTWWRMQVPYLNTLVERASFIELREVNLGYNFPTDRSWIKKTGINGFSCYVQARNLGLIWTANKEGYHPEWLPGSPRPMPTFLAGLNIQF